MNTKTTLLIKSLIYNTSLNFKDLLKRDLKKMNSS